MPTSPLQLAVIGAAQADDHLTTLALEVGEAIAASGAILLCGGRSGVMEAAARGAQARGGRTVGILPGASSQQSPPNPFLDITLYTGMGQARNQILVLSGDAVIGIGGGWGTLTEIGLALKHRIPVVLLASWDLDLPSGQPEPLLQRASGPEEAVELALAAARSPSIEDRSAT